MMRNDANGCRFPRHSRRALLSLVLLLVFGSYLPGTAHGKDKPVVLNLALFDANPDYTGGVFLPVRTDTAASLAPLTSDAWSAAARPVRRVAADGVTLLLLRAELPRGYRGPVKFRIEGSSDPGSLWRVDDRKVTDNSAAGGARDDDPPGHKHQLSVQAVRIGNESFAFALYRAPRDFDPDGGPATAALREREAHVRVQLPGKPGHGETARTLAIVRPLVIFIHGTWGSAATWQNFPLWQNSANEMRNFQFDSAVTLPFAATRVSFDDFLDASGPVVETAQLVLPRIVAALKEWRQATGSAGTQADVITHSFGGFVTRMVAQTQPDPDPLTPDGNHNFRAAANWGHGLIHKLITLAATHRGSAEANHLAYLNHFGHTPGALRELADFFTHNPIDNGAVRDQMVLSPALRSLEETRVPGHSIAGSGLVRLDDTTSYAASLLFLQSFDVPNGPYQSAGSVTRDGNPDWCAFNRLSNYIFNLDYNTPPLGPEPDCDLVPNYDLTVSEWSSRGLMPRSAFSNVFDINPALVGRLNHLQLHESADVSDRIVFLLRQPTTSRYFAFFPAVMSIAPTPLEERFSTFDPAWLYE
jgi:pimeloyl-ACP methyl ester carboxylesterase